MVVPRSIFETGSAAGVTDDCVSQLSFYYTPAGNMKMRMRIIVSDIPRTPQQLMGCRPQEEKLL